MCVPVISGEEDVTIMVSNMKLLLQSSLSQVAKLKERYVQLAAILVKICHDVATDIDSLVGAELEHSASLSGAVTALRQDEKKRMTEAVKKVQSEEEVP